MIRNYIKTAFRSLLKNKGYSFLNIFGLAIGIACAALIFLWVEDEVNFDAVHVNKDRLYIVEENQKYDTYVFTESSTPGLMGPAIKAELPGVANTCRTSENGISLLFATGNKSIFSSGMYAEPSIFNMFTLPFVEGNAANALSGVQSLVISETMAKKFFGNDKSVVGKTMRIDNKRSFIITGVIKDQPANSSMQVDWIMPFQGYFDQRPWLLSWGNQSVYSYVELKPGVNPATIDQELYNFIQKREPAAIGHSFLFSMNNWHLYNDFKDGKLTGGGRIGYVHLFTAIAWIIIFIACINFMNLATARSEKRAREVGVRKVLGAGKGSLILQFIGEAMLMAFLATITATFILTLVLPAFNTLVQKQLSLGLNQPYHLADLFGITVICGLAAGSYPSLYLSSFSPVSVLKGLKIKNSGAAFIRKGLVIMQFTVSIVLIISTVIIYQQIKHVQNRQLGFNKDNLVEMNLQGQMGQNYRVMRQDLLNTGFVENVTTADHSPLYGGNNTSNLTWAGKPEDSKVLISRRYVTPEFIETTGIKLIAGRNLNFTDTLKSNHALITQSLEKLMGSGSAVGKIIRSKGDTSAMTVVGVVKDYVYDNIYGSKSDPVIFLGLPIQHARLLYIRLKPGTVIEIALNALQAVMQKDNPAYPFDYHFVDEQFNRLFATETLVSKLSTVFASLAIIISCLGLFGLAAYTAERRIKEIGIRKVLGASVAGVTSLLSKDFLQLVVISCLLAFPLAYWVMQNWLKHYEYRVDIQWWVFLAAGAAAVVIALVTISFQSIKAAIANPVESLRSE